MSTNNLQAYIQHRGYQYRMQRQGRGQSHEIAFADGAKLILDMIRSGELSTDKILTL